MLRAMTLLAAALVFATEAASAQTISACVRSPGGFMYNTMVDAIPPCVAGDSVISWNVQGPAGAPGDPAPVFEFVGYSTGAVLGDVGIVGLHQTCHGDFGIQARTCTSQEFTLSSNIALPDAHAWLLPEIVGISDNAGAQVDYSGVGKAFDDLSCSGWFPSMDLLHGLVVLSSGQIRSEPCNVARPVTCCAPAP